MGDRMQLSLPLPKSPKGRSQRYCPNVDCVPRRFQMGGQPASQEIAADRSHLVRRLRDVVVTTCPYCGTDAADQEFIAPEDIENAKDVVKWSVREDMSDWIEGLARDFNRNAPRGGFISMSMETKRSLNPSPHAWREDLLRGLTCDACGRDYGVYAIALFCPDCGARNVHVHFAREVALVERQVVLAAMPVEEGDDELAFRLLGNAHEDVLTALETYLRSVFLFLVRRRCTPEKVEQLISMARRGNPFQSVERATDLFQRIGCDPFGVLSSEDSEALRALIGKRHVIGHNLGLVDEKYLAAAGDGSPGENIRLLGEEVRLFAQLAFAVVVTGLEEAEAEFLPSK